MLPTRRAIYAEHGTFRGGALVLSRLEYHAGKGGDGYAWEGAAWYGGDYDRLWVKSEGEARFRGPVAAADIEGLWGHALDPWFDLQAGVRDEIRSGTHSPQLVIGLRGVAPYWINVDAAAFLSTRGDLTARIQVDYDQRITSQLILQPRIEFDLAAQTVRATDTRAGLSSVTAGLRLRYEIAREFAPYLGVEYAHDFADGPGSATERGGGLVLVAGVRAWF
jgi:copper resistance protein B